MRPSSLKPFSQSVEEEDSSIPSLLSKDAQVSLIRGELVALTGNHFLAIVLNQLLYWTQRVKDFDLMLEEEKALSSYNEQATPASFSVVLAGPRSFPSVDVIPYRGASISFVCFDFAGKLAWQFDGHRHTVGNNTSLRFGTHGTYAMGLRCIDFWWRCIGCVCVPSYLFSRMVLGAPLGGAWPVH